MKTKTKTVEETVFENCEDKIMINKLCREFKNKGSLLITERELGTLRKNYTYCTAASQLENALEDVQRKNGWKSSYHYIPLEEDWKTIDYERAQSFRDAMTFILSDEDFTSIFISVGDRVLSVAVKLKDGSNTLFNFLPIKF